MTAIVMAAFSDGTAIFFCVSQADWLTTRAGSHFDYLPLRTPVQLGEAVVQSKRVRPGT